MKSNYENFINIESLDVVSEDTLLILQSSNKLPPEDRPNSIGDDLLDRTPELTEEPHTTRASHILRPLYDLAQKHNMLK